MNSRLYLNKNNYLVVKVTLISYENILELTQP